MVYNDSVVVDFVAHPLNNDPNNLKNDISDRVVDAMWHRHTQLYPEEYHKTEEQFHRDPPAEDLEKVLFLESDVDYAVYHTLTINGYFEDGHSRIEKGIEFRDNNPERVSLLGSVNPIDSDPASEVKRQIDEAGVDGFKLLPSHYEDGKTLALRLDDPETLGGVVEEAVANGIDTIAIHKAVPIGASHWEHERVGDVEEVAIQYPDVDFVVVHAGYAFLEETKFLLARYPNVYGAWETVMNYLIAQPRKFAEILGELLLWAGDSKLMFGTGVTQYHPQILIEEFWDFEIDEDLKEDYGYPDLTDERKRKILGLNACDVMGIDPEELKKTVRNDKWEAQKNELDERPKPWSTISA